MEHIRSLRALSLQIALLSSDLGVNTVPVVPNPRVPSDTVDFGDAAPVSPIVTLPFEAGGHYAVPWAFFHPPSPTCSKYALEELRAWEPGVPGSSLPAPAPMPVFKRLRDRYPTTATLQFIRAEK
ncbi:hypothetical protein GY45DRAFT_1369698 [Cubamyces sp. BRFM 1775]|nr:hypothetical protein GY45DRAFT_1369698 [Cubamyces sp. BRFM 1775]